MTFALIPLLLLPGLLFSNTAHAEDKLRVVTSIRPLQLITNEIMLGAGQASVLIDSNQSPHHFQLRPSQLKLASETDLLIWVSNEFEAGLGRLQDILPASSHRLQLAVALDSARLIGDQHELDGHIWLSPINVIEIAQLIEQQLIELDPANRATYRHNAQQLIDDVERWRLQSLQQIQKINPGYILDHNFLAYLERDFGLKNGGSLRDNHNQTGSLRQLAELHQRLQQAPPSCLLVTKLPISQQARQISQRYRLKITQINTLDETDNHKSILDLLKDIITSLSSCQ
ncbi:MAG: zinc ABC transporter substrate-binding protein [Chloroflexi bacterium]|nr:zinc ABC transporter substrate-binding protein [Chloroflexota bacterium]